MPAFDAYEMALLNFIVSDRFMKNRYTLDHTFNETMKKVLREENDILDSILRKINHE